MALPPVTYLPTAVSAFLFDNFLLSLSPLLLEKYVSFKILSTSSVPIHSSDTVLEACFAVSLTSLSDCPPATPESVTAISTCACSLTSFHGTTYPEPPAQNTESTGFLVSRSGSYPNRSITSSVLWHGL